MAICKLCNQNKTLLKKSHIIPNFMYNGLFDENHKIITSPIIASPASDKKIRRISSGEYEKNILCSDCDNKVLGHYCEDYASRVFSGEPLSPEEIVSYQNCRNQHGVEYVQCKNINYNKFKLFLLSILWRASISVRPFFKEIYLKEKEDEIKNVILNKNAGDISNFPINIFTYIHNPDVPRELIAQPRYIKTNEGVEYYSFLINGYMYLFYVSSPKNMFSEKILEMTLTPDGGLRIIKIPPDRGWDFLFAQFAIKKPSR